MNRPTFCLVLLITCCAHSNAQPTLLKAQDFRHYIDTFIANDDELYRNAISNKESWGFLEKNIPWFDCPDKVIERTYYFRWWTYRKHIAKTPSGYIITEFMPPVPWAGKYNGISCPAGFHFSEGRWLHSKQYLDDYAKYWFNGEGSPRTYSFWSARSIFDYCNVKGDFSLAFELFPALVDNYNAWERDNLDSNGLYRQEDGKDGMEVSVCGASNPVGYRATINAYMYGDARALALIARMLSKHDVATAFDAKADTLQRNTLQQLWDKQASFFKVLPVSATTLCDARELHGYTPWFTGLAQTANSVAWKFLMDSSYFSAPFGLTSVERNHPGFRLDYSGHECQWNGPSWPYATSVTLTAMGNLLNDYHQEYVSRVDYMHLLHQYAASHRRIREDGKEIPWIDENLNPLTGDWLSRTRLKAWDNGRWSEEKGGRERGKDYNHSLFCDLVISGLVGLRPRPGNEFVVNPLVDPAQWNYFCLDNVLYHGSLLTIMYDRTGRRYGKGKGLRVFKDGQLIASAGKIQKLTVRW